MLDIKYIRNNKGIVAKAIKDKACELNLDQLLDIDTQVSQTKTDLQKLQTLKNTIAKDVPRSEKAKRAELIEKGKKVGGQIKEMEPRLRRLEEKLQLMLYLVPNIPMATAPIGTCEDDNEVIRIVGLPPEFNFDLKNHREIVEQNQWAEFERAVKVSGERAYTLKGELLLVEMALHNLALKKLAKRNFQIMSVVSFARDDAFLGTGHFPKGKDQVYHLEKENQYLIGTSEIVTNSFHSGEILKESELPIFYGAYGPCFRSEAGSSGRDVGGLMRVHQFNKTEQYILCKNDPAESEKWHQLMLEIAEELVCELEIPYRVVECCTGDMGVGKFRMNDIEVWVPSENRYRESHSGSTLHDWQARRSGLRYRDGNGEVHFCHTLNCTAIATPRILIPLMENHQRKDGSVCWPKKLKEML
ncbi:MAG: serine--tRNA ligase [Bacteriovoracaceae bacterium]|jgi:seryl-tRNA synthetase|nr:serine--tRNA ligase [Bacteriovoracaceae bacterium]